MKGKNMALEKKQKLQNGLVYLVLLSAYLVVTLLLFHWQAVGYDGKYWSDDGAYLMEIQGMDSGYDFPYPILFWTGRFFSLFTSPQHGLALAVTLLNGLTPIALLFFFHRIVYGGKWVRAEKGIAAGILVFSLLFVSMLFPLTYLGRYNEVGEGFLYRYLGVFSPNPYHNATYLAARAFSVPAFFLFAEILDFYEKENRWYHPKYVLFSVWLLLATLSKPSFSLVMACAAGCIMLWRLFFHGFRQGVKAFFQLGIWFIPTFLVLLYQFGDVFRPGKISGEGIGIGFLTAWSTTTGNVPWSIFRGMAFPLAVLVFCILQREVPKLLRFSWQFYLAALCTLLFLYEKGYRMAHVNFAWGYMYALFFSFAVSLMILVGQTARRKQPFWQLGIQWGMYGLHLICGVDYFRVLFQGGMFH